MNVKIFDSNEQLYDEAANVYIDLINNNPYAVLGFATGTTPIPLYQNLIRAYQQNKLSFKSVTTYNLDEYIGLPQAHSESYYSFMRDQLFNHVDITMEQTHIPHGFIDPKESIEHYNRVLSKYQIDLQLLGVGSNGHIGFNEPGASFESTTHVTQLTMSTIKDNSRMFASIDEVPTKAITMGIADIMKAKQLIVIVTGRNKADAVQKMIEGPVVESHPASILQKHLHVIVFLDRDAASKLTNIKNT